MAKEYKVSDIFSKISSQSNKMSRNRHREINLVPDIKDEMIKALKLRNLIFFLCLVVAIGSVCVTLVFGLIAGGQQVAMESKKNTIEHMSDKINSYGDLNDFLTIKDQLGSISSLTNNKKVLSRTFNILTTLLPTGTDTITISELEVDLGSEQTSFTFDAQANSGSEPSIDYNVLDAFKKSMQYMRYDYGNYVDKENNTIPAYCIIETGSDGATLKDPSKGYYAFWTIDAEGCNSSSSEDSKSKYNLEEYDGQQVVKIWRTPQFAEWYKEEPTEGQPYMSLSGEISNVEHFNSQCITYTGDNSQSNTEPKWTDNNEACKLVPDGENGITIKDSSNGRDAGDELVLRFSAIIALNPEVYRFDNHHMLTIPPSGRRNVTDSYVQVQAMFSQRAADCAEDDVTCNTNKANEGGN